MDDKKTTKSKTKKQVHSKKGSLTNGNSVTRKGKEKETMNGVVDDDSGGGEVDWEACDSFLPTYVYEAMKLKKRFDHMRVCIVFFFLRSCLPVSQLLLTTFYYRVVIKKMRKSSLGFTLRLLKKSFFQYYTLLTHPSRRKRMLLWKRKRKLLLLKMMVGWRLENGIGLLLREL